MSIISSQLFVLLCPEIYTFELKHHQYCTDFFEQKSAAFLGLSNRPVRRFTCKNVRAACMKKCWPIEMHPIFYRFHIIPVFTVSKLMLLCSLVRHRPLYMLTWHVEPSDVYVDPVPGASSAYTKRLAEMAALQAKTKAAERKRLWLVAVQSVKRSRKIQNARQTSSSTVVHSPAEFCVKYRSSRSKWIPVQYCRFATVTSTR